VQLKLTDKLKDPILRLAILHSLERIKPQDKDIQLKLVEELNDEQQPEEYKDYLKMVFFPELNPTDRDVLKALKKADKYLWQRLKDAKRGK
jgi:hypothetical protein